MAVLRTYSDYKVSNVEWVGTIPNHWEVKPLFSVASTESVKNSDGRENNVLSLSYGKIIQRDIDENFGLLPESFNTYQLVSSGDLILRLTDLQNDKRSLRVGHAKEKGIITSAYLKLGANQRLLNEHYFYRLLHSYDTTKVFYGMGGGLRQSMRFEEMRRLPILLPPIDEQQKIANFLDHETAKIDTLIAKQQQLIQLLKEKRQAVISHAVTKGLNPGAPMRDSGVEWLGEVPAHWDVRRIGLLFSESNIRARTEEELFYPVLSISIHNGISDKELNEEELDRKVQRSEDRSLYKVVHRNFLAYNMMRAWQGGFGASKLSGLVSPAYVVCLPTTTLDSYYFELVLRMQNAVTELKRFSRGITDFRLRLYWDEFKCISVPVPTKLEIEEIIQSISVINSTYDNLCRIAEQQIKLLQERRTALISAAVTGKIDVRNWVSPDASNTPNTSDSTATTNSDAAA